MAIDLDALQAKLEKLTTPSTGGDNNSFLEKFYQIPDGSNAVRILPWKDDSKEFYAETKIHRVPGTDGKTVKNVHCRKVHGENCPLCDLYYALWKTGSTEDEALARKIKPRARYYMNIVDRESGDIKILSVGIILFKKIIGAILDPDFGDITDLEKGHDFKIVKEWDGEWPKYDQSAPRPKSSAAAESKQEAAALMESLHEVHELVKLEDYEDVKNTVAALTGEATVKGTSEKADSSEPVTDDEYLNKLKS